MLILKIIGTLAILLNAMFMYGTMYGQDVSKALQAGLVLCHLLILYLIWN